MRPRCRQMSHRSVAVSKGSRRPGKWRAGHHLPLPRALLPEGERAQSARARISAAVDGVAGVGTVASRERGFSRSAFFERCQLVSGRLWAAHQRSALMSPRPCQGRLWQKRSWYPDVVEHLFRQRTPCRDAALLSPSGSMQEMSFAARPVAKARRMVARDLQRIALETLPGTALDAECEDREGVVGTRPCSANAPGPGRPPPARSTIGKPWPQTARSGAPNNPYLTQFAPSMHNAKCAVRSPYSGTAKKGVDHW